MIIGNRHVFDLIKQTFLQPASVAQYLMTLGYPRPVLWLLVVLVSVLSVLTLAVFQALVPMQDAPEGLVISPLAYATIIGASLVILVFAINFVGQVLGGNGTFDNAMVLMIWIQFMAIPIQLAQAVLMLVVPAFVGFATLGGLVLLAVWLTHFVTQLHGFDSLVRGFGTLILALIGMVFGLAVILTMIGVTAQAGL